MYEDSKTLEICHQVLNFWKSVGEISKRLEMYESSKLLEIYENSKVLEICQ